MAALRMFSLRLILSLPAALLLSVPPASCGLAPEPHTAAVSEVDSDAEQANAAWEQAYGSMDDEERLAGVVLEPEGE